MHYERMVSQEPGVRMNPMSLCPIELENMDRAEGEYLILDS